MKMKISLAVASILISVVVIAAASPDCSVGDVRLACPKNFKPVPLEPAQQYNLYYWKKYNVGLFVAAPAPGYDESKFMANVIKTSLAKMFPKDSQDFDWKGVRYSGRISKFEIDGTIAQGFNGTLGVLIKYRRLKFNGRDIVVGYASDFGRGRRQRNLLVVRWAVIQCQAVMLWWTLSIPSPVKRCQKTIRATSSPAFRNRVLFRRCPTTRWTGPAGACFASSLVRRRLREIAPTGHL